MPAFTNGSQLSDAKYSTRSCAPCMRVARRRARTWGLPTVSLYKIDRLNDVLPHGSSFKPQQDTNCLSHLLCHGRKHA